MSKLSQIYLGGWALVLGLMLLGVAAARTGISPMLGPSVIAISAFQNVASHIQEFVTAAVATWIIYSLPFVPFWVAERRARKGKSN